MTTNPIITTEKPSILNSLLKIPDFIGTPISLVIHTFIFGLFFAVPHITNIPADSVNIFFTTLLSLEAIYLAIFIQISVNRSNTNLTQIQEDVEEINENVDDIQEDIDEIQEDVEEINENVDDIQEDVEEIQEDEQNEASSNPNTATLNIKQLETQIKDLKTQNAEMHKMLKGIHDVMKK